MSALTGSLVTEHFRSGLTAHTESVRRAHHDLTGQRCLTATMNCDWITISKVILTELTTYPRGLAETTHTGGRDRTTDKTRHHRKTWTVKCGALPWCSLEKRDLGNHHPDSRACPARRRRMRRKDAGHAPQPRLPIDSIDAPAFWLREQNHAHCRLCSALSSRGEGCDAPGHPPRALCLGLCGTFPRRRRCCQPSTPGPSPASAAVDDPRDRDH